MKYCNLVGICSWVLKLSEINRGGHICVFDLKKDKILKIKILKDGGGIPEYGQIPARLRYISPKSMTYFDQLVTQL